MQPSRVLETQLREDGLPELVPARYALEMLQHYWGGPLATKGALADLIRDGALRAYALETWHTRRVRPPDILRLKASPSSALKFQLDPKILKSSDAWVDHAKDWDWKRGKFFVIQSRRRQQTTVFSQVQFVEEDVDRLLEQAKSARRKELSAAGAPPRMQAWHDVWLAMVRVILAGPFTRQRIGAQQLFIRSIINELGGDKKTPLRADAIRPQVRRVYALLPKKEELVIPECGDERSPM